MRRISLSLLGISAMLGMSQYNGSPVTIPIRSNANSTGYRKGDKAFTKGKRFKSMQSRMNRRKK